jgi:integrase/recombinase XerD
LNVSVYTRHSASCPKKDDMNWKRCRCPKWHYSSDWNPTQRSAKTRSWDEALERARKLETGEIPSVTGTTVSVAVKAYLSDMKDRGLSLDYQAKVKRELEELSTWSIAKPAVMLSDMNLATLGEFRRGWTGNQTTRYKRQERLRSFFLYCVRHGWIQENQASGLSRIKLHIKPTVPLRPEEFQKCVEKCATERTRTMLLLLRWSGLRITDAATLERARLNDGKLLLYTQKTGTPVHLPLPPFVVDRLKKLKGANPKYFFWAGTSLKKSAGVRWWENLKKVFRAAGLPHAHPHMLRDTFAVECLLAGVPLDQVSILLAHSSIKVTEKHYAPWVKARQDQLEMSVRKAWGASDASS